MHARALILIAGILLLYVLFARQAMPSEAACSVNTEIDSIRYQGDDNYLVTVSLSFAASENAFIKGFGESFFIQTDRGWAPLKVLYRDTVSAAGNMNGTLKKESLKLVIPLHTPDLFRTYEGDVSLMQKVELRCGDRRGGESGKEEERLYWITPRTSKWVLREGM